MQTNKILVADDDEVTVSQLVRILSKKAFEVLSASDGEEAWQLFVQQQPDIVLTDFKMPKLNGLDLLGRIHEKKPQVPTVLMTGFGNTDIAIQALRQGVSDYITKPIDLDNLEAALDRARQTVDAQRADCGYPAVLLADDDKPSRRQLARVLGREGFMVVEAEDGAQALTVFEGQKIDLAVLDIRMPHMDGLEALARMRQLSDDFETIMATGYGDERAAIKAMRNGATGFLHKPVDLEELFTLLENALKTLQRKRSLKYRRCEVRRMGELTARLAPQSDVVVRGLRCAFVDVQQKLAELMDDVTNASAVLDRMLVPVWTNHAWREWLGADQGPNDASFGEALEALVPNDQGVAAECRSTISAVQAAPIGTFRRVQRDGQSIVSAIKLGANHTGNENDYVLLLVRRA